eukprot:scaffold244120_cov43-Cyclotella_meneghiniana.AAC.1
MSGRETGPHHPRPPLEKRVLCGGRDCSGPRQSIHLALQPWLRTIGFGAENRSMCITLLVSTARCVTETDRPNVLLRRCECDGCCPLTDMGRLCLNAQYSTL